MKKIALSLFALAALSTASFAERNRDELQFNGGVSVESAALAITGDWMNSSDYKDSGR